MDSHGFGAWFSGTYLTVVRICIYRQNAGSEYGIIRKDDIVSSVFTISANGKQETFNVGSFNQSMGSADGQVFGQWPGNLETGIGTPEASAFVAIDSNYQSQPWTLENATLYTTWQNNYTTAIGQLGASNLYTLQSNQNNLPPSTCSSIPVGNYTLMNSNYYLQIVGSCLTTYAHQYTSINNQSLYSGLLTGSSSVVEGSAPQYNGNYNNSQAFQVTLQNNFRSSVPTIDLKFSGTFLAGVLIPEGIPKIISVSSSPFTSASNGTVKIEVQNIGNAQGTFFATISNCGGINTVPSAKYAVNPGQTQEIDMPVYSSGAQTLNTQCNVTVTDYNGGKSSSSSVNIVVKQPNQCTPNSQVLQGQSFCPCLNESGVWKIGTGSSCTTCSYGVISNGNGGYSCASSPVTTQTTIGQQTSQTTTITYNSTLTHKDVVIVTVSSKLNEDSTYKNTLSTYENQLTSEGLSYTYIELNTFNPGMNINDWASVKTTINKIEYQTTPTYLIILGDVNIVPMPSVYNPATFDWNNSGPNNIPTDDPYGTVYNNSIPSIVVARIPGVSADDIASMLQNDMQRRNLNNNKFMIIGDGVNSSHDNFIQWDVNYFSNLTTGLTCANNQNCLWSPPYCLASNCNASTQFKTDVSSTYGIQYYDCHGSGWTCGDYWSTYDTITNLNTPKLNTYPIVLSSACHDGIINNSAVNGYTGYGSTLALTMLDQGASAYIGNTKFGYGYYSPTELAYVYNRFKSGNTIGQAFLSMKQKFLTNPNDNLQEGTAHELQLYGDPTLSMS